MKSFLALAALTSAILPWAKCTHPDSLHGDYPFSHTFHESPSYVLHWMVDLDNDMIRFAINSSARGWVGLGLSKTGQMIGSDVVTGWVDGSGKILIQDRYASMLSLPAVDAIQDWQLVGGGVYDGHTLIEVERKLSTCDDLQDITISTSTLFLVWSMSDETPPTSPNALVKHNHKGSYAINLLGELKTRSIPQNTGKFTLQANEAHVPSIETSYWCQVVQIQIEEDRYIYKFEPSIQKGSEQYVHHMLVYRCPFLNSSSPASWKTSSKECGNSPAVIRGCRGANVMAGWAIGGKGFFFPEDVAYKIGPEDTLEYAVLEIHYDNQKKTAGHVDSSGIRFHYGYTAPKHRAGVMAVGHHVTSNMLIPPDTRTYEIYGNCSGLCTGQFLPKDGIHLFGGLLHTHLLGKSLILRHFRTTETCDGIEELPYVDFNSNYNTDYQQVNKFPQETKVLPGDTLSLQCFYDSSSREDVTLGGEGINEEMCLTFLFYYPQQDLTLCTSMPVPLAAYSPLASTAVSNFSALVGRGGLETLGVSNSDTIRTMLEDVTWTSDLKESLQLTSKQSPNIQLCLKDFTSFNQFPIPQLPAKCPYSPQPACQNPSTIGLNSKAAPPTFLPAAVQLLLTALPTILHTCVTIVVS